MTNLNSLLLLALAPCINFDQSCSHSADIEKAIASIHEASGDDVQICQPGTPGIPITFQPDVISHGESVCGNTRIVKGTTQSASIAISDNTEGCLDYWQTIRHEIFCHAMTGYDGHATTGVCSAESSGVEKIDAASVNFVCSHVWMGYACQ